MSEVEFCFVCNKILPKDLHPSVDSNLNIQSILPECDLCVGAKIGEFFHSNVNFISETICSVCFNLLVDITQLEKKLHSAKETFVSNFNGTLSAHGLDPISESSTREIFPENKDWSFANNEDNESPGGRVKHIKKRKVLDSFNDEEDNENEKEDTIGNSEGPEKEEWSLGDDGEKKKGKSKPTRGSVRYTKKAKKPERNGKNKSLPVIESKDANQLFKQQLDDENDDKIPINDELYMSLDIDDEEIPYYLEFTQNHKVCPACKKVFGRPRDTLRHMFGPQCKKCGDKSPATLKCLENKHFTKSSFVCKICVQTFDLKCLLVKHIEDTYVNDDKRYQCPKCEKNFNIYVLLAYHYGIHTDCTYKPHKCTYCDAAFTSPTELKYHTIKHEGGFECKACNEKFPSIGKCKRHYKVEHTQEVNSCNMCGKTFASAWSLKLHMKGVHTQEKMYKCKACSKEFGHQGNFREHMATHSGRKRLVCDICGYMTNFSGNMSKHRKRRHQKNVVPKEKPNTFCPPPVNVNNITNVTQSHNPEPINAQVSQSEFISVPASLSTSQSSMGVFLEPEETHMPNIKLVEAVDLNSDRPVYICLENLQQIPVSLDQGFVSGVGDSLNLGVRPSFTIVTSSTDKSSMEQHAMTSMPMTTKQELVPLTVMRADSLDDGSITKVELSDFIN